MPAIMGKDLRWLPAFSNGGEEKKVKKLKPIGSCCKIYFIELALQNTELILS